MKWTRSKVRQSALLALFALAIQLILSLGHFHAERSAQWTRFAQVEGAAPQQLPAHNHQSDGLGDISCAICAVISLASNLLTPTPPQLPIPVAFAVRVVANSDFALPDLTRIVFRSRAPPLS
jgi:hypothetical protein